MADWKLTRDPDTVIRVADGANVSRGHRWWSDYEDFLADGGTPDPAETFEEMQNRYFDELAEKTSQVLHQGVDGPFSVGDETNTPRAWSTRSSSLVWLLMMQRWIEDITDPAVPARLPFYTMRKKSNGSSPGDLAGLKPTGTENNTVPSLQKAIYDHFVALIANLEILWKAIDDATVEADLLAIDLDSGWPPPPVNP